jgi:hypothetical protein
MAGSFVSNPHGAEISERSSELVLPDRGEDETRVPLPGDLQSSLRGPLRGKEIGVSEPRGTTHPETSAPSRDSAASGSRQAAKSLTPATDSDATNAPDVAAEAQQDPGDRTASRGFALPGDRGPRHQEPDGQRPSFWRRIALGRRAAESEPSAPSKQSRAPGSSVVSRESKVEVGRASATTPIAGSDSVERRIVEPMLQALVSVEAKLERSHTELVGRSDQVEQRLTQLWDIEEQLGTLSELQESLLQVSEQQRRLESAVVSQTRTLRWLVGAVFVSLAAAAFVVAAILR